MGPRIGDGSAERCNTVFIDGSHCIENQGRCDIVDRYRGRFRIGTGVVIGQRGADGVGVARRTGWIVIEVRVCFAEGGRTGWVREGLRSRPVTPVYNQGKGILGPRIGDGSAERCKTVFIDGGNRIEHQDWSDIVDRYRGRFTVTTRVIVRQRGADGVGVARRTGWIVIEVCVCFAEGGRTGWVREGLRS